MNKTLSTDNILILWLLAAAMAVIVLLVSAHTHKVSAPAMQWQADTSWTQTWNMH